VLRLRVGELERERRAALVAGGLRERVDAAQREREAAAVLRGGRERRADAPLEVLVCQGVEQMTEPSYMTADGREALRAELERLETVERNKIAEQIKTARGWGDLKENAEYHAAKDAQAHLETKILQLREQLLNAQVVEDGAGAGDVVVFGSTVEVEDEASAKRSTYKLVSAHEASPSDGAIAFDSPVGVALRDHRVGEVAVVETPRGERRLKVLAIS
jgi:transcription elongation factor GreA